MIFELLFLFLLSQVHSAQEKVFNINVSYSADHKVVLEPDKLYDISCSGSSQLKIEFSKPGTYYIKQLQSSGSSNVIFLKSPWKRVQVNVGRLSVVGSSCVNIATISKCISVEKELITAGSCVIKDTILTRLLYWF